MRLIKPQNQLATPESWLANWSNLNTSFAYPMHICKAIYTTKDIESLNSVSRYATKKRKIFPTDDSVKKVIYLAIMVASKKWTMPIQNWKAAINRFSILFEERVTKYFEIILLNKPFRLDLYNKAKISYYL